jgi:hypothetical protein
VRVIKTLGYLISSLSVLLLGLVAWDGVKDKPLLQVCLVLGMATSITGMFCRWLSYQIKEKPPQSPAAASQEFGSDCEVRPVPAPARRG